MTDPIGTIKFAKALCEPEIQYAINKEFEMEYQKRKEDLVNHPPHYKSGGIETIDFIEAKQLGYHLGNVVKYISRAGIKSHCPLEDLKKAQWYLDRHIENMEKQNG